MSLSVIAQYALAIFKGDFMTMVFCRGCGKELHESAPTCPHCGFVQNTESKIKDSLWMGITAFILAVLCILNWFNLPKWDADMTAGLWMFSIASLILGAISLQQKRKLKVLSIISVIAASLTIFILVARAY